MDSVEIQEALNELKVLGIVKSEDDDEDDDDGGGTVTLDLVKLKRIGYTLIFDEFEPRFIPNNQFMFMYDVILYASNKVPKSSLYSYKLLQMKMFYASNK